MLTAQAGEWRRNYRVVIAGAAGMLITIMPPATIGVFIAPLESAFGWSRTAITAAAAMTMLVAAVLSPPVGKAIERYGVGAVAIPGVIATPFLFAAISLVNEQIWVYLAIWFFLSCAITLGGAQAWTTAVSRAFVRDRGLAIGVTLAGGSIAGIASAPLAAFLLEEYGWRVAHVLLGAIVVLLFVPPILFLFRRPRPGPPTGDSACPAQPEKPAPADESMVPREVLRSSVFWRLQLGLVLGCVIVNGMAVHLIPMLIARGLTGLEAASAMSALGLLAFISKFAFGYLIDRFFPPVVMATTRLIGVGSALLLLYGGTDLGMGGAILAAVLVGAAVGSEISATACLTARYFGMAHFPIIYAWSFGANRLASGIGPMLLAILYDGTGDYSLGLTVSWILLAISAVLILTLEGFKTGARVRSTELAAPNPSTSREIRR